MKKWKILNNTDGYKNADEVISGLLTNRGVNSKEDINTFLNPDFEEINYENVGIDKKQLKKALKRIREAIKNNEKIIVFGDYDVDGICSTAILWETIFSKYKNVIPYIPNRVEEGYGLSINGINNLRLKNKDCRLIITVDNGIVANEAVKYAKKEGIDVIITDHHILPQKLPEACAIVHTTQICGAGIAYLLAQEISNLKFQISNKSEIQNTKYRIQNTCLELVTLATIADLVPLIGSNRCFVKFGLEKLRQTKRPGLIALFEEARVDKSKIGTYEVGYIIGPRINASGRLSTAMDSLRLLCTKNNENAKTYARNLNKTNRERQLLTQETVGHARMQISKLKSPSSNLILVYHETYQQGVTGLVASKLVEEFYRPSFVVSVGDKYSKGSARSIYGVNILEFIRSVSEYLVEAGGHAMAAGFTIETDKIELFKLALQKRANEIIEDDLLKKTLIIDLKIEFKNINFDLYKRIYGLSPFGIGNPQPLFITEGVYVNNISLVGANGSHMKLLFEKDGIMFNAIAFGFGENKQKIRIGDKADIAYTIEEDTWNGNKKLQLKIKDLLAAK